MSASKNFFSLLVVQKVDRICRGSHVGIDEKAQERGFEVGIDVGIVQDSQDVSH